MAYEMTSLLMKCEVEDFAFLIEQIEGPFNLSSDSDLTAALGNFRRSGSEVAKSVLVKLIEREVRYLGSSEAAYAYRKLLSSQEPAGVSILEIVNDVSKKLTVRQKAIGTLEARLERLVKSAVEKAFFDLKPEQQRELFEQAKVGSKQQGEFFDKIKSNKAHFLPLLFSLLGPEITASIVQGLTIAVIAQFIGREAAKELLKNILARFPWWAEWLGPIVWSLSLSWLAFDLQGAAYRKTIPILLYLGIVGLRDGPEDGDAFWTEASLG
ncbi:hypothetical protein E2553_46140 [Paraburkholderia dipogonis]|uniref:Uncharacterized protein n=1 Tax=Paraburkholderia dipogonis TaxID=1211383 RepID=A0A4Y8MHT2_9BURK|nr:hypothetical protein [Paraburkholderia dipogonis]TFE36999.1 hypothetical protein E2553_46140 [Paraburkholderia dipogonis]